MPPLYMLPEEPVAISSTSAVEILLSTMPMWVMPLMPPTQASSPLGAQWPAVSILGAPATRTAKPVEQASMELFQTAPPQYGGVSSKRPEVALGTMPGSTSTGTAASRTAGSCRPASAELSTDTRSPP